MRGMLPLHLINVQHRSARKVVTMNILYATALVVVGAIAGSKLDDWLGVVFPNSNASAMHKIFYMAWGAALFTVGRHIM